MMSYWLETMILDILGEQNEPVPNIQWGLCLCFAHMMLKVLKPCPDPKLLGPDLNETDISQELEDPIITRPHKKEAVKM